MGDNGNARACEVQPIRDLPICNNPNLSYPWSKSFHASQGVSKFFIVLESTCTCIFFLFLLFLSGCGKDENPEAGNETNGKTTAVFNPNLTYGSVTDQDGNIYKTIKIGSQTWMAENLRTTK